MTKPQIVVGISGGSGSGKTSILRGVVDSFPNSEVCIVSQDNYYKPIEDQSKDENGEVNFDLPESIDVDQFVNDMNRLIEGKSITKLEYTFNNEKKEPQKIVVEPSKILLVEGLFIFHFPRIVEKLNLSVFVETDEEQRLQRRIKRDAEERGYPRETVMYQWKHHVEPAYENYLKPYKGDCQLIIDNNISLDQGIIKLRDCILNEI